MKKVQKAITADLTNGAYFNFFRYGENSLPEMIKDGWNLIYIKDKSDDYEVIAVFEKEQDNQDINNLHEKLEKIEKKLQQIESFLVL